MLHSRSASSLPEAHGAYPSDDALRTLAQHSVRLIVELQHDSGAYPASPDFSAYAGYCWFRDGSFIAEATSRGGTLSPEATTSATAFHEWCAGVLRSRERHVRDLITRRGAGEAIPHDEMLPTRFTFAGRDGDAPWWDFQLDGYGTWLWALTTHAGRHSLDLTHYRDAVELAVDYLTAFWNEPCFDWWEEHAEQRHVSTLGSIVGGLEAAARALTPAGEPLLDLSRRVTIAETVVAIRQLVLQEGTRPTGALRKWLGSPDVDASLASCVVPFGLVPLGSASAVATLDAIIDELEVDGGVHRFRADVFYGGGQWPLLSCLLGWNLLASGDREGARRLLGWAAAKFTPDHTLPEQVSHHLLHPDHRDEWMDRWGTVADPLLWSHAMFAILADELGLLTPPTA